MILNLLEGHHKKTGALLVGNPCLKELKGVWLDLPCAQEEEELIASILKTIPLVGRHATKAEVMKQMLSVGLIHIAAHTNRLTGEIALSPNPGWTSQFPQEDDFILKMSDVQATSIRARLVVLSCCHNGRGVFYNGEGVVGIARAFFAAGARSVLVSLWVIEDEATMVFMKSFYRHLKEGKTASVAVHQSIKSLRESEQFSEMRYWSKVQTTSIPPRVLDIPSNFSLFTTLFCRSLFHVIEKKCSTVIRNLCYMMLIHESHLFELQIETNFAVCDARHFFLYGWLSASDTIRQTF